MKPSIRRVVVGFSGGVSSAWCGGWALRNFPKDEVVFLFHDTKEEDEDTYRFLYEMAERLDHPITERSDGRSLTELCYDENAIPNDRMAFCSRILKAEQCEKYFKELREQGVTEIVKVVGFSANEPDRVQRITAHSWVNGYSVRFPIIEEGVTKQQCADWCTCTTGVEPPAMYEWSDHANCPGCFRGGKAYWLAVKKHRPLVFEHRKQLEEHFGHTISHRYSLVQIEAEGLKRSVGRKEAITIGPCECGD
jgi:hypothetical protein